MPQPANTELAVAELFVRICQRGFDSPQHWAAWWERWSGTIATLPFALRKQVEDAHNNAGPREEQNGE